jgi:hypothetical protein
MHLEKGAVFSSIIVFFLLVVAPIVAIMYMPPALSTQLEASGLNFRSFITQTIILGLLIAFITLGKGIVDKASLIHLILDIAGNTVSLVFALLVIGIGNISNLGLASFKIQQSKVILNINLDLRIFLILSICVVVLNVIRSIFEFNEAKKIAKTGPKNVT